MAANVTRSRQVREQAGLTLQEAARKIGVTPRYLGRCERPWSADVSACGALLVALRAAGRFYATRQMEEGSAMLFAVGMRRHYTPGARFRRTPISQTPCPRCLRPTRYQVCGTCHGTGIRVSMVTYIEQRRTERWEQECEECEGEGGRLVCEECQG